MEKIDHFETRANRLIAYQNFIVFHRQWHKEKNINAAEIHAHLMRKAPLKAQVMQGFRTRMIQTSRDFIRGNKLFEEWRDSVEMWSANLIDEDAFFKRKAVRN